MQLELLEHADLRSAIKTDFPSVEAQCLADVEQATETLTAAGQALRDAQALRESTYTLLSQLNKAFRACAEDLRLQKTIALSEDLDHQWKAVINLRQRRERIAERIEYVTRLKLPEAHLGVHVAEMGVESSKANLFNNQVALDRCRAYHISWQLKQVDPGSVVDVSNSASAKVAKVADRILREVLPEMEVKREQLTAALTAARDEAATSLFG